MKVPDPIQIAKDAIFDLDAFVKLTWGGLGYAENATRLIEAIRRARATLGEKDQLEDECQYEESLKDSKKLEKFAKNQAKQGFPYLYETAIIRLWTILEAVADDLVLAILEKFPKVLETRIVQNLKGPLVDFLQASPKERAAVLLERLKREVNASLQPGVGRFESVFKTIDFGGPVPDATRRQLLELSEVRHVIIHRNSKIDTKIVGRCPWLGLKVGKKICPTHKQYMCSCIAVSCYLSELLRRCVVKDFGEPGVADKDTEIRVLEGFIDESNEILSKTCS